MTAVRQVIYVHDGGRALLPVDVRNETTVPAMARLTTSVARADGSVDPILARWIIVPGESQSVPAGGTARFLVLVDPPSDVPTAEYVLRIQPVREGATSTDLDLDLIVPVSVGPAWSIRVLGAVPTTDDGVEVSDRSTVAFEVFGPPNALVRVTTDSEFPFDPPGKFPTEFLVQRPLFRIAATGRDSVHVLVVRGTSTVLFRAFLMDAITGQDVARSDLAQPIFPGPPFEPIA